MAGLSGYVSCEARVPEGHPLRLIRAIADEAFEVFSPQFEGLHADAGRPSIAAEKLLRSLLLQALYAIGSERQLIEQLDYNLLFRWFVGLPMDARQWDPAVFSEDREQLLTDEVTERFLATVISHARVKLLLSDDHFSPDHRLIAAWSLPKSLRTPHRNTPSGPERNKECDSYQCRSPGSA